MSWERISPQHGSLVILIERVVRVNEEKPPVILLLVLMQDNPYRVYPPFYPHLKAAAELFYLEVIFYLRAFHRQDAFDKTLPQSLYNITYMTPRSLSIPIRRPSISAQFAAHGGC